MVPGPLALASKLPMSGHLGSGWELPPRESERDQEVWVQRLRVATGEGPLRELVLVAVPASVPVRLPTRPHRAPVSIEMAQAVSVPVES